MKIYISKNSGVLRDREELRNQGFLDRMELRRRMILRKLALFAVLAAAIFLLAAQGAYAMTFTAFTSSPDTDTTVRLDWSAVPGARIYQILRLNSSNAEVEVTRIDVNSVISPLSTGITGYSPDTEYTFIVKAYSDTGLTALLDSKTAVVQTTKTIKPYNLSAEYDVNAHQVTLSWKSSKHAVSSTINRTENGVRTTQSTASTVSAILSESGSAPVQYSIVSTDRSSQNTDESDSVTVTPIAPPIISVASQSGTSRISWTEFAQVFKFQLERSHWNGTSWDEWSVVNRALSGQGVTDTPPTGGLYRYRLGAKSDSEYSGYSNISDTASGLPAPSGLTLSISASNRIDLSWTNGAGNVAAIEVQRKISNGTFEPVAYCSSSATSYSDTVTVTSGAIYVYRIRSFLSGSSYSAWIEASTSATGSSAPSNLTANVVSSTAITLSWTDNSSNETGFRIERAADSGTYTEIASVGANTTTYNDTTVSTGHTYLYRIRAYNSLGNSAYSGEATVSSWDSVAPTSLTVTPVSSTRLDLSWTYTGTENYNTIIERKTGADGTWSVIYTTALGALKYSDTGLSSNTRYFYRIRKSMGTGSSGLSYPNNDIGIGAYTNLGNLTLSGSAAVNNTIYLTWTGNSGTADVVIERRMSSGSFSALNTVSYSTTGWYDNTGLVPSASYTYRIKARTSTNESVYSNIVTVQNLYLDAPSQLAVTVTSNSAVELNWKDNSTDETGFEIWRYIYGSGTYTLYATVDKNVTTFTDKTIQKSVQYSYMVRAYVATGALYSPYSNSASVGSGLINPPSNLYYEYVSSTQVLLRWTDTSDNENGFKVEWKIGSDGAWNIFSWTDANVTAYNVSNLNPYTKYYFRIRAYSSTGNSDSLSDEILVSTAIPAAPSGLAAVAQTSTQIKLTWKDNSDSETSFQIKRKAANSYYYDSIAEVGKNVTAYYDSNLVAGMRYSYKVVAYNTTGTSESSAVEVKTSTKATFSDLKSVSWAKEAIETMAGMGVMKGVSGSKFMPGLTVTKAEFTAMVVRAFELDTAPVGNLADVKSNKWYYKEVMIAENLGIISGDANNKFYPDRAITREEIAVILFKVLQSSEKSFAIHSNSVLEKFSDKDKVAPEAVSSVATMIGEKIMEGISANAIGPKNSATRAQAAVLLYRTMNKG